MDFVILLTPYWLVNSLLNRKSLNDWRLRAQLKRKQFDPDTESSRTQPAMYEYAAYETDYCTHFIRFCHHYYTHVNYTTRSVGPPNAVTRQTVAQADVGDDHAEGAEVCQLMIVAEPSERVGQLEADQSGPKWVSTREILYL